MDVYTTIKRNSMKPVIKFNGGRGAILCVQCSKILKEDLSREEFDGVTDLIYCEKCENRIKEGNALLAEYCQHTLLTLNYNELWEYMMLVVKKIECEYDKIHCGFEVVIRELTCEIRAREFDQSDSRFFISHFGRTKIDAVWSACVNFASYYKKFKENGPKS